MPDAKKFRLPALRISSTGVAQEDRAGGGGDSTSSILKSPFAASGTPFTFVLRSVNGAVFSQMSVAKTLMTAAPPEADVPIAVSDGVAPGEHEALPVGRRDLEARIVLGVSPNASEICRFVGKFASSGDPVVSRSHLSYAPEGFGKVALISEAGREPDFEDAQIGVSQHSLSALDALPDHILVGTGTSAASEEPAKMVLAHPCD